MLHGREKEQNVLAALVERAHIGCGAAVILHGEPGIGKTALLDNLAAEAAGTRMLRATSAEPEAEFGYATLHQLLLPVLDRIDRLPDPQSSALGVVFGQTAGPAPEPFLVGLATLSLLSDLASDQPVVCLVDDVQWIDRPSARVLEFVGRRLDSEPIVLVLAAKTSEQPSVVLSRALDLARGRGSRGSLGVIEWNRTADPAGTAHRPGGLAWFHEPRNRRSDVPQCPNDRLSAAEDLQQARSAVSLRTRPGRPHRRRRQPLMLSGNFSDPADTVFYSDSLMLFFLYSICSAAAAASTLSG